MKLLRVLAVPAALTLVAACGGGGTPSAAQSTAPGSTATGHHGRPPGQPDHGPAARDGRGDRPAARWSC